MVKPYPASAPLRVGNRRHGDWILRHGSKKRLDPIAEALPICARFTVTNRLNRVVQEMVELMQEHAPDCDLGPRYNISPTQQVAAVRATADTGKRELVPLNWA
jgi:SOS response associated peptidase (SRAP)